MSILNVENCIFLIIDFQDKLLNAVYNKDSVLENAVILSKAASLLKIPVCITEQYPKGLGNTKSAIQQCLMETQTKTFEKTAFNALVDPVLAATIKSTNRTQVVVFGIETHICVHQTVDALLNDDYEVHVIQDICSSRFIEEHSAGLMRMKDNGAIISTTEIALFELLKTAKNPNFKTLQSLIK